MTTPWCTTLPAPIRVPGIRRAWDWITQSGPTVTSPSITAQGPTRTDSCRAAAGSTMAVGWMRMVAASEQRVGRSECLVAARFSA